MGGVSLFNVRRSLAAELPDPASVLAKINVGNYVKKDYRDLYKLADDEELWDPAKDWIRTVDWEAVRKEFAGKTVKFAIGAADAESAADGLKPFQELSGHHGRTGADPGRFALRQGRRRVHLRQCELRCAAVLLALAWRFRRLRASSPSSTTMPPSGSCRSTISTIPTG